MVGLSLSSPERGGFVVVVLGCNAFEGASGATLSAVNAHRREERAINLRVRLSERRRVVPHCSPR